MFLNKGGKLTESFCHFLGAFRIYALSDDKRIASCIGDGGTLPISPIKAAAYCASIIEVS